MAVSLNSNFGVFGKIPACDWTRDNKYADVLDFDQTQIFLAIQSVYSDIKVLTQQKFLCNCSANDLFADFEPAYKHLKTRAKAYQHLVAK